MLARRIMRRGVVPVLAVAALLPSGCGATERASRDAVLRVGLSEYRLRPNEMVAHAGQIRLSVVNYGRATHNLVVSSGARSLAATPPIKPGGTATLVVTLHAGTYTVASQTLSDEALGEHGTLRIVGS